MSCIWEHHDNKLNISKNDINNYYMTKTNTVEPRYNKPLYNEVLGATKRFLYSSNSMEKNLDIMNPQYSEQILPVPWP